MNPAISKRRDTQQHLPTALQLHILAFLPPNDRAISGRLVSPDAAAGLTGPDHCTASLSQPLPPHAVPWAVEAGQQHVRQLSFWQKLQVLCTAAASGSETNLEVAWSLLQPSIFPVLVQHERSAYYKDDRNPWGKEFVLYDPGVAAVRAGHLQLLPWLLHRCPGLLWPERVLEAAARYCDLAGLREALALLNAQRSGMRRNKDSSTSIRGGRGGRGGGRHVYSTSARGPASALGQRLLEGAAESETPDAVQKMSEILGTYECSVTGSVAKAAVRSRDLARLRWLRDREGWDMRWAGSSVLHCALVESSLPVVQWLVEEGGCELPAAEGTSTWGYRGYAWDMYMTAAARSADGVVKLQWLNERGATLSDHDLLKVLAAAISAGHVDVAQHLLSCMGPRLQTSAPCLLCEWGSRAAASGSVAMAEFMRQAGAKSSGDAYIFAMEAASLPMVRWLVDEAKASAGHLGLPSLILRWGKKPGVLEAVQLLVRAGVKAGPGLELGLFADADAGRAAQGEKEALQMAAQAASPDLVQYLLQLYPNARPDGDEVSAAANSGCEAVLDLLVPAASSLEVSRRFGGRSSPYLCAGRKGDRGTLTALRRLGVPWGGGGLVLQAVQEGCKAPVLRWLVEQGALVGVSKEDVDWVAARATESGTVDAETAAWLRGLGGGNDGGPSGPSVGTA